MYVHFGWKHILMLTMQVNGKLNILHSDSIFFGIIFNSINWQAERKNEFDPIVADAVHIAFNLPSNETRLKTKKKIATNKFHPIRYNDIGARVRASNP